MHWRPTARLLLALRSGCSLLPSACQAVQAPYLHPRCLQVAGSGWKLDVEGQRTSDAPQDPQFSTWEEVINRIKGRGSDGSSSSSEASGSRSGSGSGSDAAGAGNGGGSGSVAETAFYTLLGVEPTATQADIKSAYRKLALQLHPDVSSAPDASERFAAVAAAYDVLSNPDSRALYNRYGAEGMRNQSGGLPELLLCARSLSDGVMLCGQHTQLGVQPGNQPATSCIGTRFTPPRSLFRIPCVTQARRQAAATPRGSGLSSSGTSGRTSTRRHVTHPQPATAAA